MIMINDDQIAGKWKKVKGNIKEQWGKLTDDDLNEAEGKADILVGKIQEKYGKTKAQANAEVNKFFDRI